MMFDGPNLNFTFNFLQNFKTPYLCKFLSYDNDQIMKKYLFLSENLIFIILLARAHYRARCAPCQMPHKCHFWLLFKVYEAARGLAARANFWRAPSDRKSKMQHFMYL